MSTTPVTRTYRVKLKRVVFAEIDVQAETAQQARKLIEDAEEPLDYFNQTDCLYGDEITVSSVARKPESSTTPKANP